VSELSFDLQEGEVVALVGPEGAGKTTIIKLLCGMLAPSEGAVEVLGGEPFKNRDKVLRQLGVVFGQKVNLCLSLPIRASLMLNGCRGGLKWPDFQARLNKYAVMLGVSDYLDQPPRKLTPSQRKLCELLSVIIHSPRVLLLDEFVSGLEPGELPEFIKAVRHLAEDLQTTVVMTTREIEDIGQICDRVIMMDGGRKSLDAPMSILNDVADKYITLNVPYVQGSEALTMRPYYRGVKHNYMRFYLPKAEVSKFVNELVGILGPAVSFKTGDPCLEDMLYSYYRQVMLDA
jgi:ABC-2 type transport system ATP-binding protein